MPHMTRITAVFIAMQLWVPSFVQAREGCSIQVKANEKISALEVEDRLGRIPQIGRSIRIAFVTQSTADPFWIEVIKGLQSEAEQRGAVLDVIAPRDRSSREEQLSVATAALQGKPDALIVAPINSTNLLPVLERARATGIPTIMLNLPLQGADVYVGTSHSELGAKAAEYFHELFPSGAQVAQIEGLAESPHTQHRGKGFVETLRNTRNLTLVSSRAADWDFERARQITIEMLKANPGIRAIYAHADVMALGAVQALREIDRTDVVVVGTDATRQAKQSIAEGGMRATAAQFPAEEGRTAIRIATRLLGCQTVPAWVVSPQSLITPESLPDYNTANN